MISDNRRSQTYEDMLINDIIDIEWDMFDKVQNEGGRAGCQDDPWTFYAMRYSQFASFTQEMLISVKKDLDQALMQGRNTITEKYAYMMEYTDPAYFNERLRNALPAVDPAKATLVEMIADILLKCEQQFAARYPAIAGKGRPETGNDRNNVSFYIYTVGELKTYSETTLGIYYRYLRELDMRNELVNPAFVIHRMTVGFYGYASLEDAERAQR